MKKLLAFFVLLGLSSLILAACSAPPAGANPPEGQGSAMPQPEDVTIEGDWNLTGIDTGSGIQPPLADVEAGFRFEAGQLSGTAGCNRMGGSYTLNGTNLTVGPMFSTKMACAPELMQQEDAVSVIFGAASEINLAGDTLTISTEDGRSLTFTRSA